MQVVICLTLIVLCAQVPVDATHLSLDSTGNYLVFDPGFDVGFPVVDATKTAGSDGEDNDDGERDDEDGEGGDAAAEDQEDASLTQCQNVSIMRRPKLLLSKEKLKAVKGENKVLINDFILVGNNVRLDAGYYAKFVHQDNHKVVLWRGYISMVKSNAPMPGM